MVTPRLCYRLATGVIARERKSLGVIRSKNYKRINQVSSKAVGSNNEDK